MSCASNAEIQADGLPPFPKPDSEGNVPAIEYARASIAREIVIRRRQSGLTQAQLDKKAGVRLETISRLENARHSADPSTVEKIDKALVSGVKKPRRRKLSRV